MAQQTVTLVGASFAEWHSVGLPEWPCSNQFPNIGALVSSWGTWSIEDEHALELHDQELWAYNDPAMGNDKRLLELSDKANTLLHSYGNVFQPCPCACRASAFRRDTLLRGGLKGFYSTCHPAPPLPASRRSSSFAWIF